MRDLANAVWMALGAVLFLGGPTALYVLLSKGRRDQWPVRVQRWLSSEGGAYRGGVVTTVDQGKAPPLVIGASIFSIYLGMAWLPSVPLVALGIAVELGDKHGPGGATLLGIPGMLLSGAILVVGVMLARKSAKAAEWARSVGLWSLVHNVLVVLLVWAGTVSERTDALADFGARELGGAALGYAVVSFVHAALLLKAARVVREADELRARQEDELAGVTPMSAPIAAPSYAGELGEAFP